ncbi:MAG: amidohydrolase family protein, partial [Acidimicrobiaceae bacterium]|nr:amidohydrolase family protein [Acidimicrobiaceae bacterium]
MTSAQSAGAPGPARRVATEEAFSIPEVARALGEVAKGTSTSLDVRLIHAFYGPGGSPMLERLLDIGEGRLSDMDANGVAMHLLSLTSPGVQMFDADTATELAALANDRLAEAISRHPSRFAGLASFAPQSPKRAVAEMERAINQLGLNGFIVNSHTFNEYLDEPKYWPILEAAEALGGCIYIHPRGPSDGMAAPFRDYGMEFGIWGFGIETGTHAVRLILSGVF